jgi:hypothetical protein
VLVEEIDVFGPEPLPAASTALGVCAGAVDVAPMLAGMLVDIPTDNNVYSPMA